MVLVEQLIWVAGTHSPLFGVASGLWVFAFVSSWGFGRSPLLSSLVWASFPSYFSYTERYELRCTRLWMLEVKGK